MVGAVAAVTETAVNSNAAPQVTPLLHKNGTNGNLQQDMPIPPAKRKRKRDVGSSEEVAQHREERLVVKPLSIAKVTPPESTVAKETDDKPAKIRSKKLV